MQVPKDQFYFIDKSKIITMTEVEHDHEMVEYYTNYLLDAAEDRANGFRSNSSNGKVKPSEKMGYLGTVNTAKKKLEELFQLEVDPKAGIATHVQRITLAILLLNFDKVILLIVCHVVKLCYNVNRNLKI